MKVIDIPQNIFIKLSRICLRIMINDKKKLLLSQKSGDSSNNISDKRVTLRAVKNFMKIGRSRNSSRERDSSTEDEGR
jgi:hypothetical protein